MKTPPKQKLTEFKNLHVQACVPPANHNKNKSKTRGMLQFNECTVTIYNVTSN